MLTWDEDGERLYETGIDHGVLFLKKNDGTYDKGVAWNGLTAFNETPSGAEETKLYADNIKYLSLRSVEELGATIESYMYPKEFAECDGSAEVAPGVFIGQQTRKMFAFACRTKVGNDIKGDDFGYKYHLLYGCQASPSERAYATINDSPEAITFSWEVTTTPVAVTGHKATANIIIDTTKLGTENAAMIKKLEAVLFGAPEFDDEATYAVGDCVEHTASDTAKLYVCKAAITEPGEFDASDWTEIEGGVGPRMPMPAEVITLLTSATT